MVELISTLTAVCISFGESSSVLCTSDRRYIKYITVQKLTAAGLKRVGPHVEAGCADAKDSTSHFFLRTKVIKGLYIHGSHES